MDKTKISELVNLAFKGVALAMAVAVIVLRAIHTIDTETTLTMFSISLVCLALVSFEKEK